MPPILVTCDSSERHRIFLGKVKILKGSYNAWLYDLQTHLTACLPLKYFCWKPTWNDPEIPIKMVVAVLNLRKASRMNSTRKSKRDRVLYWFFEIIDQFFFNGTSSCLSLWPVLRKVTWVMCFVKPLGSLFK